MLILYTRITFWEKYRNSAIEWVEIQTQIKIKFRVITIGLQLEFEPVKCLQHFIPYLPNVFFMWQSILFSRDWDSPYPTFFIKWVRLYQSPLIIHFMWYPTVIIVIIMGLLTWLSPRIAQGPGGWWWAGSGDVPGPGTRCSTGQSPQSPQTAPLGGTFLNFFCFVYQIK